MNYKTMAQNNTLSIEIEWTSKLFYNNSERSSMPAFPRLRRR